MSRTPEAGTPIPGASPGPPRSDDCEEFVRALYHHHATPLLRYAARLLGGDWHKAEDLLQEATARAWRHFASAGTDPVSIRPWLFTVVRNLAIDHHRAQLIRPSETQAIEDLDLPVDDAIDRMLTTQIVLDALSLLTPAQRKVLTLTYYRGYSVVQAAEHLGIPPGTVKSRSYYALRALRDTLRARGVVRS
ncbi:sigma-70 family RNA polymerase sigma factor [Streptomyces sp. DG2A-72]|uniref:sigma-70 family RNA polymerase sigma factor n=1 Tax=Streptomyces sp. DG2A-72 TaxID=3051386 RepID=UPI00265BFAB0|nr:sigma-70 family RNA polymerase sigma factor [Streptomyces sp. DG2A-72]MDO0939064.1 sigma-70 family RNA polymerase sigma factor [Streptomyces sp. DG2A-72]